MILQFIISLLLNIESEYSFPSLYSSQVLPTSSPIKIYSLLSLIIKNKKNKKNRLLGAKHNKIIYNTKQKYLGV